MTMPDLHNFQVKRSNYKVHYVYLQHSLCSLHMIYRHSAFNHYDTICAAGPHHVKEIREIEAKYKLPRKNIVKLGYSKLDDLTNTAKKYPKSICGHTKNKKYKKILVAPSWGKEGIIESGLGEYIIKQLLNLGHEVVLRPHSQTIRFANEKLNKIKNQYKNNSSFTYEDSNVEQESLYKSDIMISDWSGVAIEYAFALNKPIIFCDVPRKVTNPYYLNIEIEPIEVLIRKQIGIIWNRKSSIEKAIKCCRKISKNNLHLLIDQYCFNLGSSDNIFVNNIKNFLN